MKKYSFLLLILLLVVLIWYHYLIASIFLGLLSLYIIYLWQKKQKKTKHQQETQNQRLIQQLEYEKAIASQQLEVISTLLQSPLLIINRYGEIVMTNQAIEPFLLQPLIPNQRYDSHCFYPVLQEFIEDAFEKNQSLFQYCQIKERYYECNSRIINMGNSYLNGCLIYLHDISELVWRKQNEQKFIQNASHELKTPISIIKGMLEILTDEDFDDQKTQKEFLKDIEQETIQLENLVAQLFQVQGNFKLQCHYVDVKKIHDQLYTSIKYLLKQKNLQFKANYPCDLKLYVDEEKLLIALNNLLLNAITYSKQGTITINFHLQKDQLVIEVIDEGIGMDEKHLDKIFDRFYQIEENYGHKGSGLGLSIVKTMVQLHNGHIEVESKKNKGSKFTIILPQ